MQEAHFSELFPQLRVRDLTGIRVSVTVQTPTGEREFTLENLAPDSTERDIIDRLGDGVFKVEAIGLQTDSRPPEVLEVRELSAAMGSPPLWKDRIRAIVSDLEDEEPPRRSDRDPRALRRSFSEDDGGDYPMDSGRFGRMPDDPRMGPQMPGMFPMRSFDGSRPGGFGAPSGDPVVVPIASDESLPLARGLSPEEQQRRIDEAREERRTRLENADMIKHIMEMMAKQSEEARMRAERAEAQSGDLFRTILAGGASKAEISPSASEYKDMLEERRRHVRELEDRIAEMRRDREQVERDWRDRYDRLEAIARQKDAEVAQLKGQLEMGKVQAQIEKLAAAGGLDGAKGSEMSTEDKMKLAMTALSAAGPILAPLFKQLGLGGAVPDGLPPGGGMPSGGDLPGL